MTRHVHKLSVFAIVALAAVSWVLLGRTLQGCDNRDIGGNIPIDLAVNSMGAWHHNITECHKDRLKRLVSIRSRTRSNCPDRSPWWLKFAGELSEGRILTHVNIGCNKGFDFLATLEDLSGDDKYSPVAYRHRLERLGLMFDGNGACNQIGGVASRPRPKISNIRKVKGYCIEPARKTFEVLKAGMESLAGDGVVISQLAMGAFRGYISFPDIEAGVENKGISTDGIRVQAMTLDEYAESQDLRVIDLLSIDTEGNDMNVLYGGIDLLSRHVVRVLEFEVHDVGHWKVSRLDNVIALLDNLGMVCYWHLNGDHPILRATRCMSEAYEAPTIKWWSNMVCVNKNEPKLLHLLESLSDQAEEALQV